MSSNWYSINYAGRPFVTVSTGPTTTTGADFGSNSTSNATPGNPGTGTLTFSTGIQEALNFAAPLGLPVVLVNSGSNFTTTAQLVLPTSGLKLYGNGSTIAYTGASKMISPFVIYVATSNASVCYEPILVDIIFDGGQATSSILQLNNCQRGFFRVQVKNGGTGSVGILIQSTNPPTQKESVLAGNCTANVFDVQVDGVSTGVELLGGPNGLTTNNLFTRLWATGVSQFGLDLNAYCDSNTFVRVVIQLTANNAVGVRFSSSTSVDNKVYDEQLLHVTVDTANHTPAFTGTVGLLLNLCYQISVSAFYTSGPFTYRVNTLAANSYFIVDLVDYVILRLGLTFAWGAATPALPGGTGTGHKVYNVNSYAVKVYLPFSSGGTAFGVHVVGVGLGGSDNTLPSDPSVVDLDTGEAIYFNTSVPAKWLWKGAI